MYAGGAGNDPRPGEVVLANHGVLYLDVPENFGIPALETLGMAIDDGEVVYKVTQDPSTWIRFASDDVWLVMSTDEPGGRPFQRALSTLNLDRPVEFIEVGYTPP